MKNQVEERKRQEEAEKDAKRRSDEEDAAIRRYLLQVESEDAMAKRREMVTLRNDWGIQAAQRDEMKEREAQIRALGINPDTCAPGAAQKFEGEDVLKLERTRMQALQQKQWSLQLMEERRQREANTQQETANYMAYLFEIERLQQSLHQASERERAQIASEIQRYNQLLADHQREQERLRQQHEQQQDADQIQFEMQSIISENPRQAALPGTDLRVRVDHWKGFNSDQTRQYLHQNDAILADKARQAELLRQQQEAEARQHAELQRIMAHEEYLAQQRETQKQLEIKQTRERQAMEAAAREKKNAEQARAKIEPGFFQNFGRSYR